MQSRFDRKPLSFRSILVLFGLLAIGCGLAAAQSSLKAQVITMPGNVEDGRHVLEEKGCLSCHALDGVGGTQAPDFAKSGNLEKKPGSLATEMWNHGPNMWAQFEADKREVPTMTPSEAADLYAYFYAALYFAPQADANRGRELFEEKQCASCHSEVLDTRPTKARVERWTDLRDPIVWAERMWNHSNEMASASANRGIGWPRLSGAEIVDLLMFLSKLPEMAPQAAAFAVGNPELGRTVFDTSCANCHSFGREKAKVNLLTGAPESITDYVAAMWNHAPIMRSRGGSTATLAAGDMRDLIAYLFSQRYFFEIGNTRNGQKVYDSKGCATCHEARRREMDAPDLTSASEAYSPITLTAAAWRHGPAMLARMKKERIAWPKFEGSEMSDLIAFLNSRVIVRRAKVN